MFDKIKSAALLTAMMVLLNICAYASSSKISVEFNPESETFTIEGTCSSGKENVAVSLNVFYPDMGVEDLFTEGKKPIETMAFHDQIFTDENGTYLFEVTIDGKSGDYPCFIKAGNDEKIELKLNFVNKGEAKEAIEAINSLTKAEDIVTYIDSNINKIGINASAYNSVSKTGVAQKLINERSESGVLDSSDIDKAITTINVFIIAQAIEDGKSSIVENIFDEKDIISIIKKDERLTEWYDDVIAENAYIQKEITKRLYGEKSISMSSFIDNIIEAVVLEIVENPNGFENAKSVILDFADEIGINNPKNTDSIYKNIAGNDYKNLDELFDAYEEFEKDTKNESSNKPSGGGGGGRGSGATTNVKIENSIGETPEAVPLKTYSFKDTASVEWAYDAIEYLYDKEIISGKTKDTFCPNDFITREEFVKLIVAAFDFSYTNNSLPFIDVDKDAWYANFVKAAYQNEIIKGISNEYFGTGENITRQDIAVIIMNVMNKKSIILPDVNEKADFLDNTQIASYANDAVEKLQKAGIINGYEDNTFRPDENATRAQAAVMIYRLLSSAGL